MKRRKTNPIGIPHTKSQWLAFVLALLFAVTLPPLSPLSAQTDGEEASSGETLSGEDLSGERDAFTYTELVDQREPFVKYFERSDGRYTAVVYPEAVHTEVDGEMVNIDNRLVYRADKRLYQTSNPTFRASFSQSAGEEDAVSVTFEGYTLSWRVETVKKPLLPAGRKTVAALAESLEAVTAVRASKESLASLTAVDFVDADRKKTFTAEEINSTFAAVAGIRYADAFGSETKIDLFYTIAADRLEEDIVLREKGGADAFVLHMTAPGLTASLEEDRSLVFSDGMGKTVFTVGAPWMYDAAGEVSEAVTVTLAQREDEVTVVYTPDAVWLKAAEREYPVVLDPSVKSRRYTSNYEDTYVISGTAAANRSGLQYTVAGLSADGKAYDTYTRIKGLPKILDAMDVTSVTMNYYSPKNGADLRMKLLDQSWNAATIEYASAPKGTGTAYTPVITSESGRWRYSFDFYNAVKEYGRTHTSMDGFFTGFLKGFRLYGTTAVSSPPRLDSAESASTGFRPFVEIVYTYKHDIPVISGGVYSLKNAASGKYLTVSASDDNAYQYEKTGTNTQAFTLIGGNGCFTIRPVSRSGKALGYEYSADTTGVTNGNNVMAKPYSAANADKEEFIIQYVDTIGGYDYYALISRADTSMALSVVGNSNGSMSGTGSSSPGNAYMYAYTGASSQLWTLESGGQPVFIGNSIVEENGETMGFGTNVLDPFIQPYCAVTSFGDTITWSSSDSSVIHMTSEGRATLQDIGVATLKATIKNSSGVVYKTYSYTVSIVLADGVYYIRNTGSGRYLDAAGRGIADGTGVSLSTKITSGENSLGQLWKICHLGEGRYSVRPMRKLDMGLSGSSSNASLTKISTQDSVTAVSEAAQWKLGRGSAGGYKLLSAGNTSRSLSQSGTNAVLSAESGSTGQNWIFESAAAPSGILIYNAPPSWLAPEESSKVVVAVYSPYSNNQTVTWSTGDSSVAAVSSTGVLTGKGPGSTTLTLGPNSAHRIGNKQFTINVTAVANGRYYIQNRYYDSLLQPDDGGASHMEQFSADGQADQKWYLERYDEDCYRIRNLGSNLYLTSPNTAAQDEAIVQAEYSAAAAERQLWRFVPTTEGSYKIQSRAMEENAHVMAIGWALVPSSGVNVEQRQYTADTDYGDEWRITPYHHRLNLEVYVDQAYKTRYPEYQQRILENLTGVQEKVLEDFGIYVDFTDPIDYWSLGDECDSLSGGDYNSPCTHGPCANSTQNLDGVGDQTTHHKNIYNILYNTPLPDLSQTARIVFTGHTICAVTSQGHKYDTIKGVCLVNKGLCIIANHDGKVAESRTTLHEIMHWYGAPDHYEQGITEMLGDDFNDLCLYGLNKQNFPNIDEVVFCPGCLEKIYQNLDKFDH